MSFVDEASGFKEIYGIESASATITLVPPGVLQRFTKLNQGYLSNRDYKSAYGETAMRTYAFDIPIGQEPRIRLV